MCGGPETEDNCPSDCGSMGSQSPELNNFTLSADTVNTSTSIVNVLYELSVSDPDDYLSDYIIRLILNGGPINGGEIIETAGQFSDGLSIASVSGAFVFPIGTTEGQWNARVIINDESNNQTNMGPNQLSENNFQNYVIVENSVLDIKQLNVEPEEFSLLENYPNPFNPSTTIRFQVPFKSRVNISVFNILGNHIETIVDDVISPGSRSTVWEPDNSDESGVYFIHLKSKKFADTKKIMFIK